MLVWTVGQDLVDFGASRIHADSLTVYLAVQLTSSRLRLYVLLYGKRAFTHVRDYRNDSKTQVSFLEGSRGPDWKGSRAGCGPRAASWTTLRHGVKGFLVAGGQIFQRYFDLC